MADDFDCEAEARTAYRFGRETANEQDALCVIYYALLRAVEAGREAERQARGELK